MNAPEAGGRSLRKAAGNAAVGGDTGEVSPPKFRMSDGVSVVVPCFNEGPVLERSAERLRDTLAALGRRWELIFVDDGSEDGTRDRLPDLARRLGGTRVVLQPANGGRGAAVRRGVEHATQPLAGFLDIDLEVDSAFLPRFLDALDAGADLAVGCRSWQLNEVRWHRAAISTANRVLSNAMLGHGVPDPECGFKFFRRAPVWPILAAVEDARWFWDTEFVDRAVRAGLKVRSVPVRYVRNPDSPSTVRPLRDSARHLEALARYRLSLRR